MVEKQTATGNAVVGTVMDGTLVVSRWTNDVRAVGVVAEGVVWYPGEVYEAIPLSSALCIELVCINVGHVLC